VKSKPYGPPGTSSEEFPARLYAFLNRIGDAHRALTKALIVTGVLASLIIGVVQKVASAQPRNAVSPIIGVWRLTELTTTGPSGKTNPNPQPGLLIFTGRYYSFNAVTSDAPRPELPIPATSATDKQKADAFGPFHAVAGTYEIKGNELRFSRVVAKAPTSMLPGNSEIDAFRMEGDTLWMTESRQNPVTWKLKRVE
jgi:hypothetical protein